jgi:hypothetical protein
MRLSLWVRVSWLCSFLDLFSFLFSLRFEILVDIWKGMIIGLYVDEEEREEEDEGLHKPGALQTGNGEQDLDVSPFIFSSSLPLLILPLVPYNSPWTLKLTTIPH